MKAENWVPRLGLECHAQLNTVGKLFCACRVGLEVCPICQGHPGALPRLQPGAVGLALRAALAFGSRVPPWSRFSRKHYFYPDTPKGFQITQGPWPLAWGGAVEVEREGLRRRFGLRRIHLEEDAGRIFGEGPTATVDGRRAGAPLIEIVGEPDLGSAEEAEAWLRMVHRVLVAAGVSGGDLEKGHLRCDVNVSLGPPGGPAGPRVEIKNVASFRFVARAIRAELRRQRALLEAGLPVHAETRAWDGKGTTALRAKEPTADYRMLDEPDLPALAVDPGDLAAARLVVGEGLLSARLLDAEAQAVSAFAERHRLNGPVARALLDEAGLLTLFEEALAAGGRPEAVAVWLMNEVLRLVGAQGWGSLRGDQLQAVIAAVEDGRSTRVQGRRRLEGLWLGGENDRSPPALETQASSWEEGVLRSLAQGLIVTNVDQRTRYQQGNKAMLGFFMGRLLRATDGQADPVLCNRIVREELERP